MLSMNSKNHSFTQLAIFLTVPAKPGVYSLYTSTRCVYVGESENIRESLYGHLKGDCPWITIWDPTNFSVELLTDEAARVERKNQLMTELQPAVKGWDADRTDLPSASEKTDSLPRH